MNGLWHPLRLMMNRLPWLGRHLFSQGWLFFTPYLAFYLIYWIMGWPVHSLKWIFFALHFLNLFLFGVYFRDLKRKLFRGDCLFWGTVFLAFLVPGAYLEYPSDPWSHFELTYRWQTVDFISHHTAPYKFAYFWGWTVLGWIPLSWRYFGADVYSAFWQWMVALQLFLFLRKLGFKREWAWVQIFGFFALFGTNLFSYRYYALASTPLAYVAYFRGLIFLFEYYEHRSKQIFWIPVLLVLMVFNHLQEVLLFLISATALTLYWKRSVFFRTQAGHLKGWIKGLLLAVVALTVGVALFPEFYLRMIQGGLHFARFFDWSPRSWGTVVSELTSFRTFQLFVPGTSIFDTYGVSGFMGLLAGVLIAGRFPLLAWLTWFPTLILLWPPLAVAWASASNSYIAYRILFAMPLSFALTAWILIVCEKTFIQKQGRAPWMTYAAAVAILILLGLPKESPWRGRLWFQFHRPESVLALKNLEPLALWFEKRPSAPRQCSLTTDHLSSGLLWSLLSYYYYPTEGRGDRRFLYSTPFRDKRRDPVSVLHEIKDHQNLWGMIEYNQICQVLLLDREMFRQAHPTLPLSEVARLSGHWAPDYFRVAADLPESLYVAVQQLEERGWKKQHVPPFYTLWSAPGVP